MTEADNRGPEIRRLESEVESLKPYKLACDKQILETEGKQKISEINNNIVKERENNLADIAKYHKDQEAAGNKELYSPQYVKLQMAQSLANNTKFYFSGQDSVLGGLLTKILAAN